MGDKSKIEWTEASWNPIVGCSKVSEGCRNCYAIRAANRMNGSVEAYRGLTVMKNGKPEWTGAARFIEERLLQPLKWQRPRMIFVNSMSDLFHDGVSDAEIENIFAVMAVAQNHTFQILTKRPERMQSFLCQPNIVSSIQFKVKEGLGYNVIEVEKGLGYNINSFDKMWPLQNVWLGVSVEDQKTADERIPLLLQTPAAVHWISAEPLLSQINIEPYLGIKDEDGHDFPGLNWVVAGGESGPNARPSHPDWFRRLRDDCVSYNVPFFFKQWGEWRTVRREFINAKIINDAQNAQLWDDDYVAIRVGKKKAARTLDGDVWNEYPA